MNKYIKPTAYALIVMTIIFVIYLVSFLRGFEKGREMENTFESLLNTNTALIRILESNENREYQKIKDVSRFFLINNLYSIINQYNLDNQHISQHQEYRARQDAAKVLKLMVDYNFNLYEKNKPHSDALPTNEYFNTYVKNHLEEFAQVK